MIKWPFKNNKKYEGRIFVVEGGTYAGDYLVAINEDENKVSCLVLPDKQKRDITKDDFSRGLELGILTLLETLPKYVQKVCKQEYDALNKDIWTSSDLSKLQAQLADNQSHQELLLSTTESKS